MSFVEVLLLIIVVLLVLIFLVMIGSGTARLGTIQEAGNILRNIRKSKTDYKLYGVCGRLGEHTPIPSWIWRAIFLLLLVCGGASE